MNPVMIAMGVFFFLIGVYIWRLTEKTPEDELVPFPGGVWRSHKWAFLRAVIAWLVGVCLIWAGLIS